MESVDIVDIFSATDSPSMQHSLRKWPRGSWRKQAEIGAVDHSWHSRRESKKWVWMEL